MDALIKLSSTIVLELACTPIDMSPKTSKTAYGSQTTASRCQIMEAKHYFKKHAIEVENILRDIRDFGGGKRSRETNTVS